MTIFVDQIFYHSLNVISTIMYHSIENFDGYKTMLHSLKKRFFTTPPKKVLWMTKNFQMRQKFQKQDKNIYRTFKGPSRRHMRRTIKSSVDVFILFLKLLAHLEVFRHPQNLFLECKFKGYMYCVQNFLCVTLLRLHEKPI